MGISTVFKITNATTIKQNIKITITQICDGKGGER